MTREVWENKLPFRRALIKGFLRRDHNLRVPSLENGWGCRSPVARWACPQVATAVVEPYQTVMYTQSVLADVAVMMNIKAPYDVCHRDVTWSAQHTST